MNPVVASSISSLGQIGSGGASPVAKTNGDSGFSKLVDGFVKQTNDAQVTSDQAIEDLVKGNTDDVQQVVLAVAKAEMTFQLFMEIRNKLIDSYTELTRMQF